MWTKRFLECVGEGECELRPIFDPDRLRPGVLPSEQVAREQAWRKDMDQKLAKRNRIRRGRPPHERACASKIVYR